MTTLVLVTSSDSAKPVIRWAARYAESHADTLLVLCCRFGEAARPAGAVSAERLASGDALLTAASEALTELDMGSAGLLELRHPKPARSVINLLNDRGISRLVVGMTVSAEPSAREWVLGQRLLRFAACDTLLLDPGETDGSKCERVLVPMEGPLAPDALREAVQFTQGTGGGVQALLIDVQRTEQTREMTQRELRAIVQDAHVPAKAVKPVVSASERPLTAIVRRSRGCDLVLVGANTSETLRKLRGADASTKTPGIGSPVAVGVFNPARPWSIGFWRRFADRGFAWIPTLKPGERLDVFDRLQVGARWNADFSILIGLSTALAAFGLFQNSAAVIIGAMLIAPLMTPLIAAGFAVVQGNIRLFRRTLQTMLLGVLTGLLLPIPIGLLMPADEPTIELMARTAPTILDFFVALVSGIAAAYAFGRPSVVGTLAGVAIAAALVPPLATVSLMLAQGQLVLALGAAILFVTNLVAIILGAAISFRALGIRGTRPGIGLPLWSRRAILGMSLAAVLLSLPLGYQMAVTLAEGQTRPMAYPLSPKLDRALLAQVKKRPGTRLILAGRPGTTLIDDPVDVGILLSSARPVPRAFRAGLIQTVREFRGDKAVVAVWILQEAGEEPVENEPEVKE